MRKERQNAVTGRLVVKSLTWSVLREGYKVDSLLSLSALILMIHT